jgi:myo-inositol-1(or 4)-monophosphatase
MKTDVAASQLLECAVAAARAGGGHALANMGRRAEALARLKHDVKLKLDVESQEKAESVIRARFPDHAILGEEDPYEARIPRNDSGCLWIIDPIDGTVNFSHGLPAWCCSVAVQRGQQVVAGAVFAPELNRLFTAAIGQPALCNGEPIHVSSTPTLAASIVCTGTGKNSETGMSPFQFFERIATAAQRPRITGCAALDICFVACGAADGYFESGVFLWDVAASGLIVQQAGGRAEPLEFFDAKRLRFVASNGLIHEELKQLLTLAH